MPDLAHAPPTAAAAGEAAGLAPPASAAVLLWSAQRRLGDHVQPFDDRRNSSITDGAAAGESPTALMTRAGHSPMDVTRIFFSDEAAALESRLLGGDQEAADVPGGVSS